MAKGQGCTLQIPLSALQPWSRGTRQQGCRNTVQGKRLFAELCEGQSSEQQLRPWYPGMTQPHAPECQVQRPDRTTYPLQALQQMKLTKRTLIHFFSHFLPSFLLLLPLSVSGGPVWKKLSFYDAISGTRWGPDSADNLTNGQEQLVFLLTVHVLVNTDPQGILSNHAAMPSFSDPHTHASTCFTRHWTHTSQTNYLTTLSPKEDSDHFKCSSLLISHRHATAW